MPDEEPEVAGLLRTALARRMKVHTDTEVTDVRQTGPVVTVTARERGSGKQIEVTARPPQVHAGYALVVLPVLEASGVGSVQLLIAGSGSADLADFDLKPIGSYSIVAIGVCHATLCIPDGKALGRVDRTSVDVSQIVELDVI